MRAKGGFGRPMTSNNLQALQTGPSSPKSQNNLDDSELRYKNINDWRDWSALETVGYSYSSVSLELREESRHWNVSSQTLEKWGKLSSLDNFTGLVCICGHPVVLHSEGGLCEAGDTVCVCPKPRTALWVDDIRYFFRVTKGPHEAHALVMGLATLKQNRGEAVRQIDWLCEFKSCQGVVGVNPARFRNSENLAMGIPVRDLNRLICEPCLFRKLNGRYLAW